MVLISLYAFGKATGLSRVAFEIAQTHVSSQGLVTLVALAFGILLSRVAHEGRAPRYPAKVKDVHCLARRILRLTAVDTQHALPRDVWRMVFSYLPVHQLLAVTEVSRCFASEASSDHLWEQLTSSRFPTRLYPQLREQWRFQFLVCCEVSRLMRSEIPTHAELAQVGSDHKTVLVDLHATKDRTFVVAEAGSGVKLWRCAPSTVYKIPELLVFDQPETLHPTDQTQVTCIAIYEGCFENSRSNTTLAVAQDSGLVNLYDCEKTVQFFISLPHSSSVSMVVPVPTWKALFTATSRGMVHRWDWDASRYYTCTWSVDISQITRSVFGLEVRAESTKQFMFAFGDARSGEGRPCCVDAITGQSKELRIEFEHPGGSKVTVDPVGVYDAQFLVDGKVALLVAVKRSPGIEQLWVVECEIKMVVSDAIWLHCKGHNRKVLVCNTPVSLFYGVPHFSLGHGVLIVFVPQQFASDSPPVGADAIQFAWGGAAGDLHSAPCEENKAATAMWASLKDKVNGKKGIASIVIQHGRLYVGHFDGTLTVMDYMPPSSTALHLPKAACLP